MLKLLSPAGSPQALKAAINAGADEVYLGGSLFNARINASNFNNDELIKAKRLCSGAGVDMHITLNTLINDREFKSVLEYVDFLATDVCPDGLIVQDLGLVKAIGEAYPSFPIPLHASTQMRIHSYLDAKFLAELGFSRVVLARELSKADIAKFALSGIETEIFVHGAMCVSESGGCLMSSVIGNRSGNKGQCAQPCRLPYKGEQKYPLSLKDMCLAGHIKELDQCGVTSLKIEGRMKSPEYVGAVTSVYRRLLDENRNATEKEIKLLGDIFSRSGFTDGYFTNKIGKDMFGVRTEADKKRTEGLKFIPPLYKRKADANRNHADVKVNMPRRQEEKALSPAKQKGFVLRFEGQLPSKEFLAKHCPNAARIDVPIALCGEKRLLPYMEKISVILPRSIFLQELDSVKAQIEAARALGIRQATVSALYQASLCKGMFIHGDYAFNAVNRKTIEMLEEYSFSSVMLSPETDGKFAKGSRCALEYIGYGRTPLMHTRTCIIQNIKGCLGKDRCFAWLTDRTGASFPVISGISHTNTIYNSLPAFRLDKRAELKKCGVGLVTLLFTTETQQEMEKVIALYESKEKPDFNYTRR